MPIRWLNKKQITPNNEQIAKERIPAKLACFSRCWLRSRSVPISKPQPKAAAKIEMDALKDICGKDNVADISILKSQ